MEKANKVETPAGFSIEEAYERVKKWYQDNINSIDEVTTEEYAEISRNLINNLPDSPDATVLEMRAVMAEIIAGNLEWGYSGKDDEYTMSAYAKEAVKPFGGYSISKKEQEELRSSNLWPYLSPGRAAFYLKEGRENIEKKELSVAEELFHRSYREAKKRNDKIGLVEALLHLADLKKQMKHLEEALTQSKQAVKYAASVKDKKISSRAFMGLGEIYEMLNDFQKATEVYMQAAEENRKGMINDPEGFARPLLDSMSKLKKIYEKTQRLDEAAILEKEISEHKKEWEKLLKQIDEESRKDELKNAPAPKIVPDIFVSEDSLGLESYARTIASLITHEETIPPLTIGIRAPWGAGKTSIMKIVQYILDKDAYLTEENNAIEKMDEEYKEEEKPISLFTLLKNQDENEDYGKFVPNKSDMGLLYDIKPRATVWFNAWKYQSSEQFWAGLAHCIITQVTSRMDRRKRELFWYKLNLKRIDKAKIRRNAYKLLLEDLLPNVLLYSAAVVVFLALYIINPDIPEVTTGGTLATIGAAIINFLVKRHKKFAARITETFKDVVTQPDYEEKAGFLHFMESDIRKVLDLVATSKVPLVIFIDDLDRIAPHKVAEVVEAINLFLSGDYKNCIFVLGMEPGMVAAALEASNEKLFQKAKSLAILEPKVPLGWKFMEKVTQLPLIVPMPTPSGVQKYLDSLTDISKPEKPEPDIAPKVEKLDESKVEHYLKDFQKATDLSEVVKKTKKAFEQEALEKDERLALAEASKRSYSQKFEKGDSVIKEFVESVTPRLRDNPRQIKRYVNLFRFCRTLKHHIEVDNLKNEITEAKLPSEEALKKFVELCIRWPQAIDCFWIKAEINEAGTAEHKTASVFSLLEQKAKSLKQSTKKDTNKQWCELLEKIGLKSHEWMESHAFREFLTEGESISEFIGCGVW